VTIADEKVELIEATERELRASGMTDGLHLIRSGDHFIDIMHQDASKGSALLQFANSLGVKRERIMAIGNYFNDLEMIKLAGLGIAMDNSPREVKEAADGVTASNNEHGVAEALLKYAFS